jgi:hypothetical protein
MLRMALIWAFHPNLHSDQNPNLEQKHPANIPATWSARVAPIHSPPNPPRIPTKMGGDKEAKASSHQGKPDQLPKWKCFKQNRVHPPKLEKDQEMGELLASPTH